MERPTDSERCLAILVLRFLGLSYETVASIVHCHKLTVGDAEKWFAQLPYKEAALFCDDLAIKRVVGRELVSWEEISHEILVKAAQVTGDDILRHYRTDYLELSRKTSVPAELKLDHWDRLVKVAEELFQSLTFPPDRSVPVAELADGRRVHYLGVKSRLGGTVSGHWGLEGSQVYFGGKREDLLSRGLFQHMDNEFPSFSESLEEFKKVAAPLVGGGNLDKARAHPLAESLREALATVIERRTFKGYCEICKDWQ